MVHVPNVNCAGETLAGNVGNWPEADIQSLLSRCLLWATSGRGSD